MPTIVVTARAMHVSLIVELRVTDHAYPDNNHDRSACISIFDLDTESALVPRIKSDQLVNCYGRQA